MSRGPMLGSGRSGRTMCTRRASTLLPPRAAGRSWVWLLPLPILWAVAAPAHAQAPALLVRDINGGPAPPRSDPESLVQVGATTFFVAGTPETGQELWKSDGTEAGTVLVKDIAPGPAWSSPVFLYDANGTLFLQANDGATGTELWKSDGTEAGTVRVKDIWPGSGSSHPSSGGGFLFLNGTLFFAADDGRTGFELWKSDGTEAGTVRVKDIRPDIRPGSVGSTPQQFVDVNGTLFFRA